MCTVQNLNSKLISFHHPSPGIIWQTDKVLIKKILTMKKLTGMKRAFSSENKKLNRDELKSVNGGYAIKSDVVNSAGCGETDYYEGVGGTGGYKGRAWLCAG